MATTHYVGTATRLHATPEGDVPRGPDEEGGEAELVAAGLALLLRADVGVRGGGDRIVGPAARLGLLLGSGCLLYTSPSPRD